MNNMVPRTTRLRWVSAVDPKAIETFCEALGSRIEIKEMVWDGSRWFLWFVPDDRGADVKSGPITLKGGKK